VFVKCDASDPDCIASIDLAMLVSVWCCARAVSLLTLYSHAYADAGNHLPKCAHPVCAQDGQAS
jgi:hypothetical protein